VPLVLATGAGAEMRQTLGIAVFSGMLGVTAFGIFFTPVFYSVIRWFTESKTASAASAPSGGGVSTTPINGELTAATDGHAAEPGTPLKSAH
jgi:multidrug efflux pump